MHHSDDFSVRRAHLITYLLSEQAAIDEKCTNAGSRTHRRYRLRQVRGDRSVRTTGVPVIDADKVARELVWPGQPALAQIVRRFGNHVLAADGSLDRAQLREIVFNDAQARGSRIHTTPTYQADDASTA